MSLNDVAEPAGGSLDDVLFGAVAAALGLPPEVKPAGLSDWRAKRITRYIDENLERSMEVAELAGVVKLSCSQFSRAFARRFGIPPHGYILERRLARARQLICETQRPLGEIAFACGFADQSHMCRRFRARWGTTPSSARSSKPAGGTSL